MGNSVSYVHKYVKFFHNFQNFQIVHYDILKNRLI